MNIVKRIYLIFLILIFVGPLFFTIIPLLVAEKERDKALKFESKTKIQNIIFEGEKIIEDLVKKSVIHESREISKQVGIVIKKEGFSHNSKEIKDILSKKMGKSGYMCLYECYTGKMLIHPNSFFVNKNMAQFKNDYKSWWKIFEPSLKCVEKNGFYLFPTKKGNVTKKFMSLIPVKGTSYMIAGIVYLDDFYGPKKIIKKAGLDNIGNLKSIFKKIRFDFLKTIFIFYFSFAIGLALIVFYSWKRILSHISFLIESIENYSSGVLTELPESNAKSVSALTSKYNEVVKALKEAEEKKINLALMKMIRQVRHDIQSPLVALSAITSSLGDTLEENDKQFLKSQTERIKDIIKSLGNKNIENTILNNQIETDLHLVNTSIDEIIMEKKAEYAHLKNIEFELNSSTDNPLFAKINLASFKRVLSNLVNNAVESYLDQSGRIKIFLKENNFNIKIIIEDSGKGIPLEIQKLLGEEGISYGKNHLKGSGSGIGIHHAINTIKSFNGNLEIKSSEGKGTKVTIQLPREKTPEWFCDQIILSNKVSTSLILLSKSEILKETLSVKLTPAILKTYDSLLNVKNLYDQKNIIFIDDDFFKNHIEETASITKFILITHDQNSRELIKKASLNNFKILPKVMIEKTPVIF